MSKWQRHGGLLTFEIAWRSSAHRMLLESISVYTPLQLLFTFCKKNAQWLILFKSCVINTIGDNKKQRGCWWWLFAWTRNFTEEMLPNNLVKLIRNNCHMMSKWNFWIVVKFWICCRITKQITLKQFWNITWKARI